MSIGVIPDLTKMALAFGQRASDKLFQTTKANAAKAVDVEAFVRTVIKNSLSNAYKVSISSEAQQKASLL